MINESTIEINPNIADHHRTTKSLGPYVELVSPSYIEHRISDVWFSRVQHGESSPPLSHSPSVKLLEQAESFLIYSGERVVQGSLAKRVVLTHVNLHPHRLRAAPSTVRRPKFIAYELAPARTSISSSQSVLGLPTYPSEQLCQPLIEEMTKQTQSLLHQDDVPALVNSAKTHIKSAVLGLFQIIAESIQAEGNTNGRVISAYVPKIGMSFSEEVCRALNTRIRLPYYHEYSFYAQLHQEICAALKFGTFDAGPVKISLDDKGMLKILAAPLKSDGATIAPKRKRASIVKHDIAIPSDAYLSDRPHI